MANKKESPHPIGKELKSFFTFMGVAITGFTVCSGIGFAVGENSRNSINKTPNSPPREKPLPTPTLPPKPIEDVSNNLQGKTPTPPKVSEKCVTIKSFGKGKPDTAWSAIDHLDQNLGNGKIDGPVGNIVFRSNDGKPKIFNINSSGDIPQIVVHPGDTFCLE